MSWENEDIDDWGTENYDDLFESRESTDDFSDGDDDLMDIEEIDFSNISGKTRKERLRKICRETSVAKIVPKKKRLSKEFSKSQKIVAKKNVKYVFGKQRGKQNVSSIQLPDNREVVIKGVDEFILSQGNNQVKNIGYYKGEKLKELVLIINNQTPNDIDIELFNPSAPLEYLYSTSNNINNIIQVAGDNKVSYTDMLFNILANPIILPNAKFTLSGAKQLEQYAQPMIFKNKNIAGHEKIFPIQNSLNIDIDQNQKDIVYWDIQQTLNRVYAPDGMDIMQYKVLSGMSVTFGFYYKQIKLNKVFYPELRNKGVL
jgi:hypothetical protein